ncbi:MAG: hypothetical protein COA78_26305 [Blastopirellula sp.]|nr:MAG: hypothetical protein COA78_26305 [Blastopirellula sp.]
MAKANTGIKQDWKSRSTRRKGTKRTPIAGLLALVVVALIAVLVWYLLIPKQPNTFFLISDQVEYDLSSVDILPRVSLKSGLDSGYEANPERLKTSRFELSSKDQSLNLANLAIGPEDTLIVYLQAHLIHDSQADTDKVYVADSNFLSSGSIHWAKSGVVDLSEILQQIQVANGKQKLLILDAGSLTTHGRLGITVNRFATALNEIVKAMDSKDDNLFILLSHSDGQQSNSAAPNRNTIFTEAVQEAFRLEYPNEDDKELTLNELYHHVCYRIQHWLGPQAAQLQTPILMQGSKGALSEFPNNQVHLVRYSDSLLPENKDDSEEKEETEQPEETMRRDRPEHNNTKIALTQFMSSRNLLMNQPNSLLAQAEPAAPVDPAPAGPAPVPAAGPMADAVTKAAEPVDLFDEKAKGLERIWEQIQDLRTRATTGDKIRLTPVDFGPQELRRLESDVMGFEQRLLHGTDGSDGTDQDIIDDFRSMEKKLKDLKEAIAENEEYQYSGLDDERGVGVSELIRTWNTLHNSPTSKEWTKLVDPQTDKIRLGILQLGDYADEVPGLIRGYELSLAIPGDQTASYQAIREFLLELCRAKKLLQKLHADNLKTAINKETQAGPFLLSISNLKEDLEIVHDKQKQTINIENILTTLNEQPSKRKAGDQWNATIDFKLLNGLRASLANSQLKPETRYEILSVLHKFSQLLPPENISHPPIRDFEFPDRNFPDPNNNPFRGKEPKSLAKLHLLQQCLRISEPTDIEAEARDIESKIDAMQDLDAIEKELLVYYLAVDKSFDDLKDSNLTSDQFDYQMLVRTHHSNDTNHVQPFELQFKDLVVVSSLDILEPSENVQLQLLQIGSGEKFELELKAQGFVIPPDGEDPVVTVQLKYDADLFDISFANAKYDSGEQELSIRIKQNGTIKIEGTVSAKIDREAYALSQNDENLESATVDFNFPTKSTLDCKLPWANEIELAVQQTGSTDTGLFFGNRVQLSMFPNRPSEFALKLVNRSRLEKIVTVTLYPVVRPANSTMPPGRIFSYKYHRKSKDEQQQELAQWQQVNSEQGQALGTAVEIKLPPYQGLANGKKAPFTSPASNDLQIIQEALEDPIDSAQVVPLVLTLSPPVEGEKPAPIDISNGMVCVIEEVGDQGRKWIKWIEYSTRHPGNYLEPTVKVVEKDGLKKLEITINPKVDRPPRPSWNSDQRLHGFANLPAVSPDTPLTILWDWEGHFPFESSPALGLITTKDGIATIESPDELISSDVDDWRPILLSVRDHPDYSIWERVFRYQINLRDKGGEFEIREFPGYQHLAITSISNVLNPAPESGLPIPTTATNLNKQNQSSLLFPLSKVLIAQVSVSAPNDAFTLAKEKAPDFIQIGLVEPGEPLEPDQSRLTKKFYGKRSSQVHLLEAKPDGVLKLESLISDHQLSLPKIDTITNNKSFRKDFVVSLRAGASGKSIEARVPIIVDGEPPEILFNEKSISVPINKPLVIEIPCVDNFAGISHITIGVPDQKEGLLPMPVPQRVIVAEGNVTEASINKPQKVFKFQLNPMDFMWKKPQSYELRILAYDKVGLVSEPVDFVVKVTEPVMDKPEKKELVIKIKLKYASGRDVAVADLGKFETLIEELPVPGVIEGGFFVFKSMDFDPTKIYTIKSSGRGTSGLLMGELKLKAESADQVKSAILKFDS